jgi:hypothetical protein
MNPPTQKDLKTASLTFFWDVKEVILLNIILKGITDNSETCVATLQGFKPECRKFDYEIKWKVLSWLRS